MPPGPYHVSDLFSPTRTSKTHAGYSFTTLHFPALQQGCPFVFTVFSSFYTIIFVRLLTVLILAVLLHDIFIFQPITLSRGYGKYASTETLDICHESAFEFTEGDEMPGVAEQYGATTPVRSFGYSPSNSPLFIKFLFIARHERLPKV